ncbi:pyridoxamine 5'-phosphate oxidase family protein [Methanocella sp. MCL-LM]|uniref:pyridoxamine 5'-phosphate oxidase family protein n=1 Tax=Methanocella sp. MCL-LM TaxID=3412035 RepID=UPI003C7092AC
MMVDWKYVAIAITVIIFGCMIALVPTLALENEADWPNDRTLQDNENTLAGDRRISSGMQPAQQDIVKLPAMTASDVDQLLVSQRLCRMALNDDPQPYIIALDYMYLDGKVYFHFADYGRKMDLIRSNPSVSVEVDNLCEDTPDFDTVLLMGKLELVTDSEEQERVAKALINSADERGGERNVAARHGLESLDISGLTTRPSAIYRLNVSDYVALRSPG